MLKFRSFGLNGLPFLKVLLGCALSWGQQPDYAKQRLFMVQEQLEGRDIYDYRTLSAMKVVPRHLFVPKVQRPYAYSDGPLSIGHKQTISQPYIVAFMTQALRLNKKDKVLEVGTGSGYQAAVLGKIVDSVFTIEIVAPLGNRARETLNALGYDNVTVRIGDGYHGWPEKAPFDAIMVTAGAETIPQPLVDQLKEGGRMILPLGPHGGVRELVLIQKRKGKLKTTELMPVRFVPFTRKN